MAKLTRQAGMVGGWMGVMARVRGKQGEGGSWSDRVGINYWQWYRSRSMVCCPPNVQYRDVIRCRYSEILMCDICKRF